MLLLSEIQIKKGPHSVNAVQITVFFSFNIKTPRLSFYKQSENIQLFDKRATVTAKSRPSSLTDRQTDRQQLADSVMVECCTSVWNQ